MKKIILSIMFLFAAASFVWAVPADPTPYKYVQPDGSVIVLRNHGDEFFHWKTDESGRVVEKGPDGFYHPVETNLAAEIANANKERSTMYARWSSYDNHPETNFGDRKVLCILAEFDDIEYTVDDPNSHFSDMLNEKGYSLNGSIGSVRDYFVDNSMGQYRPQFDVYGPVTLSQTSAYYDTTGVHLAIIEAYEQMADEIQIDDYDTDDDGYIDMILFYFPGFNEAEGGGENTIWPKQATGFFGTLGPNNKVFMRYFCTSELRGSSGEIPASIGTTCHEFSHSLGLPDFYDVDYEGSGGKNATTGPYDLMASGNYNDSGRKPPYLSALERNMLGWMPAPVGIASSGNYTLQAVQNNKAYKIDSSVPGEYFILESRNGNKWDSYLPSGLLVYHVDQSDRIIDKVDKLSAAYLWENTNSINNYFGHPCYYIFPAFEDAESWDQYVFPGYDQVTSFVPTDWNGSAGLSMTNIAHDGTNSTFTVTLSDNRTVFGVVTDTDGNPLKDVLVSLTPSTDAFASAPALISTSVSCLTDKNGNYSLELADEATVYQILMAQKAGYTATSYNLSISSLFTEQDITLLRNGEGEPVGLYKYDSNAEMIYFGIGTGFDLAVSMHFTEDEIAAKNAVGGLLKTVTFYAGASNGESIYVVVDVGGEMKLRRNVTSQYQANKFITIDVSDAGIIFPEGKDVYIGYGIEMNASEHPLPSYGGSTENHGGFFVSYDFLSSNWWYEPFNDTYFDAIISATVSTTVEVEFSTLGVSYIKVVDDVPVVRVAAGKSLKSTAWYVDGTAVETPTAISALPSGSHTYMVRLTYYDGTSERVYYDVDK
jgi:M6 family metalloprotease-like protein